MKKGKVARVAGFIGALGVSAVLVTTAVQGTGAYFTSSVDGSLSGTSGVLQVVGQGTNLNYTGLMPGVDQTKTFKYAATSNSTTAEDVWLVFDSTTAAYGAFTGASYAAGTETWYQDFNGGGMGRFGHFKIVSDQGYSFESYNLKLSPDNPLGSYGPATTQSCTVQANGNGGSATRSTSVSDTPPYCGVPEAIQIASNIAPGVWHSATVTFGLTGRQVEQGQTGDPSVPFTIVATQHNVRPDAANF